MVQVGRAPEGKPYSAKVILGYLTSWKTLLFTLIFSESLLALLALPESDEFFPSYATIWKPACHIIRLLAESAQQARQPSRLYSCSDCKETILALSSHSWLTRLSIFRTSILLLETHLPLFTL